MYLILKTNCMDSYFDGDQPDIAVIDLAQHRSYFEKCLQTAGRALVGEEGDPKPTSIAFSSEYFACLRYDEQLEDCDFYEDAMNAGIAKAKALPNFIDLGQGESSLDVDMEMPRLVIDGLNPKEIFFTMNIGRTGICVRTAGFSLDEIDAMEPHEGVLLEDGFGPGR